MTREEAMKVASEMRQWLLNDREKEALETLIPELKESEDERIIRTLQEYVKNRNWPLNGPTQDEVLAWLEKNKGQKPVDVVEIIRKARSEGRQEVIDHPDYYQLIKPVEWSEEDKNMWAHLNGYLNGFSCSENAIKQMADWFYELPNRFNLQPKQEWSDEGDACDVDKFSPKPGDKFWVRCKTDKSPWFDKGDERPAYATTNVNGAIIYIVRMNEDGSGNSISYQDKKKFLETFDIMDEADRKPVEQWPNISNCRHDCKSCFAKCLYRKERNPEQ